MRRAAPPNSSVNGAIVSEAHHDVRFVTAVGLVGSRDRKRCACRVSMQIVVKPSRREHRRAIPTTGRPRCRQAGCASGGARAPFFKDAATRPMNSAVCPSSRIERGREKFDLIAYLTRRHAAASECILAAQTREASLRSHHQPAMVNVLGPQFSLTHGNVVAG